MADRTIGELPALLSLDDDSLIPVEQNNTAYRLSGAQIKAFAANSAEVQARQAAESAKSAAVSAKQAVETSSHPPIITSENDHWWVWNEATGKYVDSGIDASLSIGIGQVYTVEYGEPARVENSGTDTDPIFDFYIPEGSSISNIQRTDGSGAPGTTDTYTITLSSGSTHNFTVYNGSDGVSPSQKNWYATCDDIKQDRDKDIVLEGFVEDDLVAGTTLHVKFANETDTILLSLRINGGDIHYIKENGLAPLSTSWKAGEVVDFVYDGTYWQAIGRTKATTDSWGIVRLYNGVDSSETASAATANAVKTAYDRAAKLLNRTTAVNKSNSSYTTYLARGEALFSAETTPEVDGTIAWQYE